MKLSPKEMEKLVVHNAGVVAQKRYARGIKLNYPEAVALIATQLLEFIREGDSVKNLMLKGRQILGKNDVMEGVATLIDTVQIEGTFPDGTKLITVHQPIADAIIDNGYALYGSGLDRPTESLPINNSHQLIPGETFVEDGEITLNAGRPSIMLSVRNDGDRSIQVGSHYPFAETNNALKFDRSASIGYRLDIPSGTAIRFEPGETKCIQLTAIAGERKVFGANGIINGPVDGFERAIAQRLEKVGKGYQS